MKLGRRPLLRVAVQRELGDDEHARSADSSRPRFILPASSPKSRSDRIFSAIQVSVSAVSVGANPASTTKPAPILPVSRPSTRTAARQTRCRTTLIPR